MVAALSLAQEVKKPGGQIVNGPMEAPGGNWIAQCVERQGSFRDSLERPGQCQVRPRNESSGEA